MYAYLKYFIITGVGCHFLLQGSFQPGNETQVSYTASRFLTD